jgi:hypothetical protein
MVDNLGIYNSHVNSDYDINKHIEQGVQFKQYGRKIYPANEHNFLQESSSSKWGSVVDAYNGDNSVIKRGLIEGMTMTEDQIQFNNLVSQYVTDYKTYTSNFLQKPANDASRKAAEEALLIQKNNIITAANELNDTMQENRDYQVELDDLLYDNQRDIDEVVDKIDEYKNSEGDWKIKHDGITLDGKMEASALRMNSMYYHVFVYLTIAAALVAFTFYFMVNPEANTLNAIYVVVALLGIYFISRYYVI